MSTRGPKSSKKEKFERPAALDKGVYSDIIQSQQTDFNGDFADTRLICDGGNIRIHGFLLQSASPLIQKAFMSQGENYPHMREVMLPDFSIKDIQQMLNLVYKGYTNMKTQKEIEKLKEMLKFFEITNVNFNCKDKWDRIEGSLKVEEESNEESDRPAGVRRSGRASKPVLKKPGNGADDSSDYDSEIERRQKRARPGTSNKKAQPVVRLTRMRSVSPSRSTASTVKVAAGTPLVKSKLPPVPPPPVESDTDSEDEDWVKPTYRDPEWFARESRRCQSCHKCFDRPAEASLCVTSHKSLRCYFCFRVYSSTDILFKHFKRRHKQAGRESTLICPFCDQAVPYKSVSCHVISIHLRNRPEDNRLNSAKKSAPPTPSTSRRSRDESPPAKKSKTKKTVEMKKKKKSGKSSANKVKLKVKDLDMTIEKVTKLGSTLTFRLQKKRPVLTTNGAT